MPKGDNIQKIIQDYKLSSPVYVGDTAGDYNASKQAGLPFVFASYGFGNVENPDYTISELKDLISLF
jgi:phosphoglycolate phosphatase